MQIANLQQGGSSTAQPAHKPLQAPISRRDTGAGGACLKVFYGHPQESPWPSTARHGGQQCQPGSTGAARSAPWECRILCPDQVCVARGETPAYTPSKQPHPCQASAGCFEAFLEKTESLQPTLGRLSLRPPAQLPCPRCPHPTSACSHHGRTDPSFPRMSGSGSSSEGQWHPPWHMGVPDKQCPGVDQR